MASGAEDPFAPKLRKLFFLMSETVTMLMMPPAPCALYRAEGLVMTSIFSMSLAGICCRRILRASAFMLAGRLLSHICTDETPRRVMLPSTSTSTPGAFCSASAAVPD